MAAAWLLVWSGRARHDAAPSYCNLCHATCHCGTPALRLPDTHPQCPEPAKRRREFDVSSTIGAMARRTQRAALAPSIAWRTSSAAASHHASRAWCRVCDRGGPAYAGEPGAEAVPYTHLTLPTNEEREVSVVGVCINKKKKYYDTSEALSFIPCVMMRENKLNK
eukprot:NODE_21220_length_764_cov_1.825746.p1 GENE.NODE_21220_length_764_cov_1.825746~~NODE_21220_length_764_cov_1.825746.p1  ORF type:complete len:165 (+),score=23.67 NODE_21220_length_764_cov_1.825746:255-749(+)